MVRAAFILALAAASAEQVAPCNPALVLHCCEDIDQPIYPADLPGVASAGCTDFDYSCCGDDSPHPCDKACEVAAQSADTEDTAVILLQSVGKLKIHVRNVTAVLSDRKVALFVDGSESVKLCPGKNLAAMVACMVAIGAAFLWVSGSALQRASSGSAACIVQMSVLFITNLTFTVMIPTSYLVSRVVGHDAAFSGLLIGIYQAGVCLGSALLWFALQKRAALWRSAYSLLVIATVLNVVGAALYCAIGVLAEPIANEELFGRRIVPSPWMKGPLIISRLMDGCGTGITVQLGQVLIVHLIPSEQRPGWMASNQFCSMLGIGLGPMIGSLIGSLNVCHIPTQHLMAVSIGYLGLALSAFVIVVTHFPSDVGEARDFQPCKVETPEPCSRNSATSDAARAVFQAGPEDRDMYGRIMVIIGGLSLAFIRGFVVSGLEASASLLLEVKYHWGTNNIGLAIGICFMACIPLKVFYNVFEARLSILNWIRLLAVGALAGCLLLFSWKEGEAMAYLLLFGDALLFPTLFLSDALSAGLLMMSRHLMPSGSILDANSVVLWRSIAVSTGRNLGPTLARMTVQTQGQNGYAAQQMLLAVVFLMIFEIFVARHAKLDPPKEVQSARPVQVESPEGQHRKD